MIVYRPIHAIKAITFDLDDTLYDNYPTIAQAEAKLKQKMSAHFPQAAQVPNTELHALKRKFIAEDRRLAWDMGKLRLKTLKHILALDTQDHIEEAAQGLFDYFYSERSKVCISEEVYHTLSALSKRVPLVAITNGNVNAAQAGMSQYFNTVLHASIEQPAKPHTHMFAQATELLALSPDRILHVGDSLINDVYGAYKAGFQSAWFAINRPMNLNNERIKALPNFQLDNLSELLLLL